MPKNPWTYKKRKSKRRKSSNSVQEADLTEPSRTNPNDISIYIGHISDLHFNVPVKNEEAAYPDTRFQSSTSLFPAKGVIEDCLPSETSSEAFKRCGEVELLPTIPKKVRTSDSSETINPIISDDCMIIEKPKQQVKIEVIDLTEDVHPISPVLCCPVRIGNLKRIRCKPNQTLQSNGIPVKVELGEETCEVNTSVGMADMNYRAIQIKDDQDKASENDSQVSTDKYSVDINKEINYDVNNPSHIQVKTEKSAPRENINKITYDQSSIEPHVGNHVQIKAEKSNSSGNDAEIISEKSHAVNRDNSETTNIHFRSELNEESEDNGGDKDQIRISNIFSVCIAKNSTDSITSVHQVNEVPIKVEQNENPVVSGNSTSLSNFSSDVNRTGINFVDCPIKGEQSKTSENCEVSNNYMSVPNSPPVCCIGLGAEHQSKVINKQQTYEKVDDGIANCSIKIEEVQGNVVCHENKNNDSSFNYLIAAQVRNKPENNFHKNSYDYEKPQNDKGISPEYTETLFADKLNRIGFSPIADGINYSDDSQLYELGTFPTPLLKYLNCNVKVEVLEISHAISAVNLIKDKEKSNFDCKNLIELEAIPNSTDSQNEFEFRLTQKKEELPYLEVNEKQSLKVGENLGKISSCSNFKDQMFIPNVKNLASNSASPRLQKSINKRQVQNPLNGRFLGDEMGQNNSPNIFFEKLSTKSESNRVSESNSPANFNSPVNSKSFLEDNYQSTISLSSLFDNKRGGTSNNLLMKAKKDYNKKLLSNDFLRQILGKSKSTEMSNDIADGSSSLKPSVDQIVKSTKIIGESVFKNQPQIRVIENKTVESVNSTLDVNKKNSENTDKNSGKFSKSLLVPNENVLKQGLLFNPSTTYGNAFGTPPNKVKISEDLSIPKNGSVKKLSSGRYKKDTCMMSSPHYTPDHILGKHLTSDILANSSDSSPGSSNFQQNMPTPPGNSQNRSFPICSNTSVQNPGYRPIVNVNYSRNPELASNCSSTLHRGKDSQGQLGSFNINQTCHSQSASKATKSSIHPHVKQTKSISTTNVTRNSVSIQSSTESLTPVTAMEIPKVNQRFSKINSFCPPNFNQRISVENGRIFLPSSASESSSSFMTQHNPHQDAKGHQSLLLLPNLPGKTSSPSSQLHHSVSKENHPPMSEHSAFIHDRNSSENVHQKSILNPPLPANSPPPLPPLPPTSPNTELSHSIASNYSQNSLHHNHKKLTSTKSNSSESIFTSLLPKQLRNEIGRNPFRTTEIYLIIIQKNLDWIHGIDKEIGGELLEVQDSYANHLMYYNTYFPLLLLECFSKISTTLKSAKRVKLDKNIYKIVHCETMQSCISFTCDSFIRHSDVQNIPKEGHIILVKFATVQGGGVKMLGFVHSSAMRTYSHKHDHNHEILKYVNVNKRTELIKIKIIFYVAFTISGFNTNLPIEVSKLTSIKKARTLNDALKGLQRSPLCNTILSPQKKNFKNFTLPRRQDTDSMATVVQRIVQSLNSPSPQLIVVESAPFTDSFLAIVQIVEEIQKTEIPGKILVCVRMEMLSQMGMNLVETSSNVIIINRERENIHEKLQNRALDVMASHLSKAQSISDDEAKSKVLQEAHVLLVVTGACFYEDVQHMARDLSYCIIHDAHSFTEPESLLPLLYGIRQLLLFGYHEESCHVSSRRAASLGYNKSLFHRAYNLC